MSNCTKYQHFRARVSFLNLIFSPLWTLLLHYTHTEIQRVPVLWDNCLSGWPSFSWCYIPCPLIAVLYFLSPSSSASGFSDFFLRMKVAYFTYSQIIRHLSCNESVVSNLTDFSQFNSDTSANQKTRQLATEN